MMKYLVVIFLFISGNLFGQTNYNVAYDSTYINGIMVQNILINESIYSVGGAICTTGECGYLSKYTKDGNVLWTKEYPQIDINSTEVMHYKDDKIYITGRAKDSIATKTLVLDTLGNIVDDWNYSVEGTQTHFSKEVYYDHDFYYFLLTEELNADQRGALYKCDYEGNLISRLVFPDLVLTTPISLRLYNDNLLVSINHRNEEDCPFGLNGTSIGATYLAEVEKESMSIIRERDDICYRFLSNDMYVTPTQELIRTVIIRQAMQSGSEGNLGIVYYDDDWNIESITEYEHDLAKSTTKIKYTEDGQSYYTVGIENIVQTDGSSWPFSDLIIQKWTQGHDMIWEKRYISHLNKKRLSALNFLIDDVGGLHIVGSVWPDFPSTITSDFWLLSVDGDGCYNGNCSDVVDLDELVGVEEKDGRPTYSIYPNPSRGIIYLDNIDQGANVEILDLTGRVMIQESYNPYIGVNLSSLLNGLYIVKLDGFAAGKVVKN